MSSSLQDLLTQDGFRRRHHHHHHHQQQHRRRRRSTSPKPPPPPPPEQPTSKISLCRDRRSVDLLRPAKPHSSPSNSHRHPAIATIVSILSDYASHFLEDPTFRRNLRARSSACLAGDGAHASLVNLDMGIDAIERLASTDPSATRSSSLRSLRNSTRLLTSVASLNSPKSRNGFTCGVLNSHLSACAHLYLSIIYKIERNDKVSARHLLQTFCDAPCLARRTLAPDLWEQLFLPHLLHLRVWYNDELELVTSLVEPQEREKNTKALNRVFNDRMDLGTSQFAAYYKKWIKAGGHCAAAPPVPLPSRSSYYVVSGRSSLSVSPCSVNRTLYQAVFGSEKEDGGEGSSDPEREIEDATGEFEQQTSTHEGIHANYVTVSRQTDKGIVRASRRSSRGGSASAATAGPRKSYSFRLFTCRNEAHRGGIRRSQVTRIEPPPPPPDAECMSATPRAAGGGVPLTNLGRAIALISSSENLTECETAVCVIANSWLDSQGDPVVETALSTAPVIDGLLEVSFSSRDDEVLELAVCVLAELVARSHVNRQVVLNADPQLEILLRLLGSNTLFLKAATLVYLLRPKAKQMLSVEWVPMVLKVMEHGDQPQTLFSVQCSPRSAAFYLLDQLLTGFDEDRNVENAKQVVALGGLGLLLRRLEAGDGRERRNAASLLATCVRAEGTCREYLAANIRKDCLLQLLVRKQLKSNGHAISLLLELLCLRKRTQITNFLVGLKNEGGLNAMHVLLVYLQQAPPEQRPIAASILLLLDLLGEASQYSVYREEGIDGLIGGLDCSNSRKAQDKCSKALLVLGGRFSTNGDPSSEAWLLKRAGLDDSPADIYCSKEILAVADEFMRPDEEENVIEDWLTRLATVLLSRGSNKFLVALSNCIENATPRLARACLVTVAWMSSSLSLLDNVNTLWSLSFSILVPCLVDNLKYDRALEERVLASLALLNFARNQECLSRLVPLSRDTEIQLQDLTRFTWTAKEILFLVAADPSSVTGLCEEEQLQIWKKI